MQNDGNIYGTCWGGYLNNWVSSQINASVSPKVAGIGLGARVKVTSLGGSADWNGQVPVGAVLIEALTEGDDRITGAYYSYLIYNVNGNWINAGQVG
jgi:type IV pilus biogenesis protein CpaD/CtpE